jgi:hypothetical protein
VHRWLFGHLSDLYRSHDNCSGNVDLHRCGGNQWSREWHFHVVPYCGYVFAERSNSVWNYSHDRRDTGNTSWSADRTGAAVHT